MTLTKEQSFYLSVYAHELHMDKREFKQFANEQFGLTIKNDDFKNSNNTTLLTIIKSRFIDITDDWDDYRVKMTDFLLRGLKSNPAFSNEINELNTDGVHVVTGEQLLETFENDLKSTLESTNKFLYQINYTPYSLYIWSDSVEDAVNVEMLDSDNLASVGISKSFYNALQNIPSRV